MTTIYSTKHCARTASCLQAVFAACAGTALLAVSGAAFAQIDPGLKVGMAEKASHVAPIDRDAHNPPTYKGDKAADTRMLLPAVIPTGQAKTTITPQTAGTACPKN